MTQNLNENLLLYKIEKLENENKELKQRLGDINLYFLKKIQEIEININKINHSNNNDNKEIKQIKQKINTNNNIINTNNNTNNNIINTNNNNNYIYFNNNINNYQLNKEILNFFNKNEIKEKRDFFSCVFSNKEKLYYKLKIKHKLKVYNNGIEFPEDTIIRCNNNDSEIYFNSVKINKSFQKYPNYYEFPVEILFKDIDDIKKGDKYELEYYLLSDKQGPIFSNNYGKLEIIIC